MTSIAFEGFDWDEGNWPKCGKHGMTQAEVEQVFLNVPAVHDQPTHSDTEQRFKAIGRTDEGRYAFVAFTFRNRRIRPVSARYMHRKEVESYERQTR
ncbi:hypothetical protein RGUI_4215 (plasmid) [Rhodovulum sp. P5]|uniref:BrnT family toxin n=1 Tax=Rhodovulum sp. P5 TaxID=1564506 RepID=UPI0009C30C01|nr:hypothetical protein RGUI_4215 [Rhodovulum sp. P5]